MKRIFLFAIVLALVAFAAISAATFAQGPTGGNGMMGGWSGGGMMGRGGMMGGWGNGVTPGQGITSTVPYGYGRGGMMGGWGYGPNATQSLTSTLPYGGCGGMMGGWGYNATGGTAITIDQAVTHAQAYVTGLGNPDLKLVEVEEYTGNFYAVVQDKSTGTDAMQLLVNKYSGAVGPEMGPNMMWNTKYSPMTRMMGGFWYGQPTGAMTMSVAQARANAAQYLKTNLPNATLEDATDTFYGYYNMDVLVNGKTYGMLSVNGYTGAVWYHTWHGDYVQTKELD